MSPVDKEYIERFKSLEDQVANINQTNQPQLADWNSLNASMFTAGPVGELDWIRTAFNPIGVLGIGDKVRIKQTGDSDYRYFYATNSTQTTDDHIIVYGGSDYSHDPNKDIIEFAYSRTSNPLGFPFMFTDTNLLFTYPTGMVIGSIITEEARISMVGNIVEMNVDIDINVSTSGSNNTITVELPIQRTAGSGYKEFQGRGTGSITEVVAASRANAYVFLNFTTASYTIQKLSLTGGPYATGGLQVDTNIKYAVLVE